MPPDLQSGALPIELEQLDGAVRVDLEINTLGCEETWSGDDEQEKIPEVPKGWKTCKWFICTMKKKCQQRKTCLVKVDRCQGLWSVDRVES